MFDDDTYITTAHGDISTIECFLNSYLALQCIIFIIGLRQTNYSCNTSKTSYMTIGSRQNLAKAKFKNLTMDDRPIEHKPSTELSGVSDQTY